MINRKELKRDLKNIRRQVERVERELAKPEVPEPGIGTVLKWNKRWRNSGDVYGYAAIRTEVGWFVTGPRSYLGRGRTWDEMQGLLSGCHVYKATSLAHLFSSPESPPFEQVGRASCGHSYPGTVAGLARAVTHSIRTLDPYLYDDGYDPSAS